MLQIWLRKWAPKFSIVYIYDFGDSYCQISQQALEGRAHWLSNWFTQFIFLEGLELRQVNHIKYFDWKKKDFNMLLKKIFLSDLTMIFVDIWTNSPVIHINRKYYCHFYNNYWKFVKNINKFVNYINLLNLPIRRTLSKKNSKMMRWQPIFQCFQL